MYTVSCGIAAGGGTPARRPNSPAIRPGGSGRLAARTGTDAAPGRAGSVQRPGHAETESGDPGSGVFKSTAERGTDVSRAGEPRAAPYHPASAIPFDRPRTPVRRRTIVATVRTVLHPLPHIPRFSKRSLREQAASALFLTACASAASMTACGACNAVCRGRDACLPGVFRGVRGSRKILLTH